MTAPNADTLYTTGLFDVGKEPWVLSMPDMKDRYYLFPLLDGWTTVFQVPGKRTTGTGAQTYAITGPGWTRHAPSRGQAIQVADEHRVAARPHLLHRNAGRLRCGPCAARRSEARAASRPTASRTRRRPGQSILSIDMKTAVRDQVNALGCRRLFHAALRNS